MSRFADARRAAGPGRGTACASQFKLRDLIIPAGPRHRGPPASCQSRGRRRIMTHDPTYAGY